MRRLANVFVEHTVAELRRLDLLIRREVGRVRLERGQRTDEEYRGLYVSEEDVDRFLEGTPANPAGRGGAEFDAAFEAINARVVAIETRCRAAGQVPRLRQLATLFGLSPFESDVLLVCLAAELDLKYERLYAYLQDDVSKKWPTVDLVLRLLCPSLSASLAERGAFEPQAPLLRWDLIGVHDDPGARRPVLLARYLKLDDRITSFLFGSDAIDARLAGLCMPPASDTSGLVGVRLEEQLAGWHHSRPWHAGEPPPVILLHGRYGAGHTSAASVIARSMSRGLLHLDGSELRIGGDLALTLRLRIAEREALLTDSLLCWSGVDALLQPEPSREADRHVFMRELAQSRVPTVLIAERAWEPGRALARRPFLRLELAETTFAERREAWVAGLNGSSDLGVDELSDLASRFRLSSGQIQDAIARARTLAWTRNPDNGHISAADLDAACRSQAQHQLGSLAHKLIPRYTWDDIVLPAAQLTTLRLIATMIRQRPVVYGEWGFDRKLSMGKGVIALFAGASGTGKTMAAEILANDLGLDLYRIDLSSVVNKYIGETEKNLERLFAEAQDSDAILFFDEADALFGKRSGVSDAHDRYANIETAYLLQRTESYNGLVMLASNLPKNMDDAFMRRIHFTVNFPAPEEPERLEIWRRSFPREAPRADDLDLEFLARKLKMTGGNIRNVVLAAAFLAADEAEPIAMRHLIRGAGYEFQKIGKMLLEGDFGPYLELARGSAELGHE